MPSEFRKLPASTFEECKQRAQALLDVLGQPPYSANGLHVGTPEEIEAAGKASAHILSEYVMNWMPQLVQRKEAPKVDARLGEE